jgi:hypothetical protein
MKTAIAYITAFVLLGLQSLRAQLVIPSYERSQPLLLCDGSSLGQELTVPFDLVNTGTTDLLIDSAVAAGDTSEFYSNRDLATGAPYLNPILWHFVSGKTLPAGSSSFAGLLFTPKSSGDKSLTITVYYHDGTVAKTAFATVLFHTFIAKPGIGFFSTRGDTVHYQGGGYAVTYDRVLVQDTLFLTDTVTLGDSLVIPSDPGRHLYLTSCGDVSVTSVDATTTGSEEDLFENSTVPPPFMIGSADSVPVKLRYLPFNLAPKTRTVTIRYTTADGGTAVLVLTIVVVANPSGVEEEGGDARIAGPLLTGIPNPFTGSTTIALHLPVRTDARLSVVDALGREVALLHDGMVEPGSGSFTFDASRLPAGVYFARLRYDGRMVSRRLVLVR